MRNISQQKKHAYFEYIPKLSSNLPFYRSQLILIKTKVADSGHSIDGCAVLDGKI